jgi:hypothetical protein
MGLPLQTVKIDSAIDEIVVVEDIVNFIVKVPAATTAEVRYSLEQWIKATYLTAASSPEVLVFSDTGGDDTLTRTVGSWEDEHFVTGMNMTVTGTTSNNSTFLIKSVSEKAITFDTAVTLTDETINLPTGVVINGLYDDASVWMTGISIVASSDVFKQLEYAPNALRFVRTSGAGDVVVWVKA